MVLMLDFGGVLVDLNQDRCVRRFAELGVEHVERYIGKYIQEGLFQDLEAGRVSASDFRDRLRAQCGINASDQQIDDAWNGFLVGVPDYKLSFVRRLRQAGQRVILLSNTNEIHYEQWAMPVFEKYGGVDLLFDATYLSYKLHKVKPDVRLFEYVVQSEGVPANEILFLDDGENNIRTAQSLGVQTHLVSEKEDWRDYVRHVLSVTC